MPDKKRCIAGVTVSGKEDLPRPYVMINGMEWVGDTCRSVDQAFLLANKKLKDFQK